MDGGGVACGINQLLDALPAEGGCRTHLHKPVYLKVRTVLFEPSSTIKSVYFPLSGVISLVKPLKNGDIVEVATVGREGVVGVPLVPGGSLAVRAISGMAGWVVGMDAGTFLNEMQRNPSLRELVNRYIQALFAQMAQAAACSRLHSAEERLSRWLLMSYDRVGTDEFAITHKFLGEILGARRATVSLSAEALQAAGLIRYHRGRVTIVDHAGLQFVACECYQVIKHALDEVTQEAHDPEAAIVTSELMGRRQGSIQVGVDQGM